MPTHHTPSEVEQLAGERRIARALLSLRVSVFLVMLMWTLDKLINPDHAARVFKNHYFLGGLGPAAFGVIGLAELILLTAFLLGIQKRLSYGLVFVFHAVSTLPRTDSTRIPSTISCSSPRGLCWPRVLPGTLYATSIRSCHACSAG